MDKNKEKIQQACLDYCDVLINRAQKEFQFITESANNETKSSAGDKHETGRAMAQIEQEKAARQLNEAIELKNLVLSIKSNLSTNSVSIGNIVITDQGNFYISIPAGKLTIDGIIYFAISAHSPMGKELLNKQVGDKLTLLQKNYSIKEII